tara:strand:+ start:1755 stop:2249 length:495 start_codon:yes stop_codon:yes gene_type:complete
MGGGPTIEGGMTEEQYRQLQLDERAFMAEQEERQMALMHEMEDKRVARAKAEMQKQERLRSKEEEALSDLERAVTDEISALDAAGKGEDKDIVMDFFGSLAKNTPGATGPYRLPDGTTASGNEGNTGMGGAGKGRGSKGGGKPSRIPGQGKTKTSGGKAGGRPK